MTMFSLATSKLMDALGFRGQTQQFPLVEAVQPVMVVSDASMFVPTPRVAESWWGQFVFNSLRETWEFESRAPGGILVDANLSTNDGAGGAIVKFGIIDLDSPNRIPIPAALEQSENVNEPTAAAVTTVGTRGIGPMAEPLGGSMLLSTFAGPQDIWPLWVPTGKVLQIRCATQMTGAVRVREIPAAHSAR